MYLNGRPINLSQRPLSLNFFGSLSLLYYFLKNNNSKILRKDQKYHNMHTYIAIRKYTYQNNTGWPSSTAIYGVINSMFDLKINNLENFGNFDIYMTARSMDDGDYLHQSKVFCKILGIIRNLMWFFCYEYSLCIIGKLIDSSYEHIFYLKRLVNGCYVILRCLEVFTTAVQCSGPGSIQNRPRKAWACGILLLSVSKNTFLTQNFIIFDNRKCQSYYIFAKMQTHTCKYRSKNSVAFLQHIQAV